MNAQTTQTTTGTEHVISEGTGREAIIYGHRFTAVEQQRREIVWKALCSQFFPKFISANDVVVDLGAGDGHFIRNVVARKKIAVDISDHVLPLQQLGILAIQSTATTFAARLGEAADAIMMSNFLEHLTHKNLVLEVLEECRRALKPGGRVLILQPNIRYLGAAYWDYIDHHIALTDVCLSEALEVTGYEVETVIPRFLPYTAKSRLGGLAELSRLYLKLPFLWYIFGKQSFIVGRAK